ncbi:MAG: hypothetical protein RL557_462 [archaeon]|jgi:hypothetical protein
MGEKNLGEKRGNSRQYSVINLLRFPESKRSQVTIFIILGLLILIVVFLLFFRNTAIADLFLGTSPVEQLEECMQVSLEEGSDIVMMQGGVIEPELYYLYEGNKLEYLCYTDESFKTCVMQKPLLKHSVEEALAQYVQPHLAGCLDEIKTALERQGNDITFKEATVQVELAPHSVIGSAQVDITIIKNDNRETYKTIKTEMGSPLYEFVILASEIINSEAKFGDVDTTSLMYKNRNIKVEKIKEGDETKVYILTDRESNKKFMFAVKSIPIPPGWIEIDKFT